MPLPSPVDIVAELQSFGVHEDIASQLAETDQLTRMHGELAILSCETDTITGWLRALVTYVSPDARIDVDAVPDWTRLALSQFPGIREVMLVFQAGRSQSEPDVGLPYMRYVLASDEFTPVGPVPGWSVRSAQRDNAAEVVPLLVAAMVDGYRLAGSAVDDAIVDEYAHGLFEQALEDGAVFVAYDGDRFAGHVTVLADQDELSLAKRLEMFDLFVLPEHRGTAASELLSSAAVDYARQRGLALRGHVSGHDENAARVLSGLQRKGWRRDTTYWLLPLDDGGVEDD